MAMDGYVNKSQNRGYTYEKKSCVNQQSKPPIKPPPPKLSDSAKNSDTYGK
ncbi:hypothetical protein DM15PD_17310 [Aristophania vespae]|nr:hypothetical protein DM15PD_17310 [Aristophania vespae]